MLIPAYSKFHWSQGHLVLCAQSLNNNTLRVGFSNGKCFSTLKDMLMLHDSRDVLRNCKFDDLKCRYEI